MKELTAETLVYIDECGIEQYLYREYAYSLRGNKVVAKISGKKFQRTNIVAGVCCGRWVAPFAYNGTTDSVLFEYWFEHCLLKEAQSGSTFVLDNATFHKKSVLPKLAGKFNCHVLFLPPYSPELNPIEHKWACLKKRLRKILPEFETFDDALETCF